MCSSCLATRCQHLCISYMDTTSLILKVENVLLLEIVFLNKLKRVVLTTLRGDVDHLTVYHSASAAPLCCFGDHCYGKFNSGSSHPNPRYSPVCTLHIRFLCNMEVPVCFPLGHQTGAWASWPEIFDSMSLWRVCSMHLWEIISQISFCHFMPLFVLLGL